MSDIEFQNLLWTCSKENNYHGAQTALLNGADANIPNPEGWNAMILAGFNHSIDVLKLLVEHGGDVNSVNSNGTTVFMFAKTKCLGNDERYILDYLLSHGADINARDKKNGWTVLRYVKGLNDKRLENYLIEKGAVL